MLKTPFYSISIFLCVILSTNKINASDYFSNARRFFSEGRFYEASIEFERAIFYESDNNRTAQYRYYKSLCYKSLGENTRALQELDKVNLYDVPDSLFFLIRYEQALCNYLNNDANQSLLSIEEIKMRFRDTSEVLDIIPLNILCLNTLNKYDDAIRLWMYYLDKSGLQDSVIKENKAKINKLYSGRNLPEFRSPEKAENLSRFVPGSGQMYSGALMEGTFNFLMNASLLGFAFYEFYTQYYFTGYFVGLGIFNKTYHGGMHRARILADTKNLESMRKFNSRNCSVMIIIMNARNSRISVPQGTSPI